MCAWVVVCICLACVHMSRDSARAPPGGILAQFCGTGHDFIQTPASAEKPGDTRIAQRPVINACCVNAFACGTHFTKSRVAMRVHTRSILKTHVPLWCFRVVLLCRAGQQSHVAKPLATRDLPGCVVQPDTKAQLDNTIKAREFLKCSECEPA